MVVHIGINFCGGIALAYNVETDSTLQLKFEKKYHISLGNDENFGEVSKIFDEIKSQIFGRLGCICISMDQNSNKFISSSLKNIGRKKGGEKVEIIDSKLAQYFMATSQNLGNMMPSNGDVIWILNGSNCHAWQVFDGNMKFLDESKGDFSEKGTVIRTIRKLNKVPDFVFFNKKENSKISKFSIQISKFVPYEDKGTTDGALIKARKMAEELEIFKLKKLIAFSQNPEAFFFKPGKPKSLQSKAAKYAIPKWHSKYDDEITAVGIDFGTTKCRVAVNGEDGIETIGLENANDKFLPSFVSYNERHEKAGQSVANANSTIFDCKRILGKSFWDVKPDETWSFKIINENEKPIIQIRACEGRIQKSPEEVVAVLLKIMKQKVELLHCKKASEVVITFPASFNTFQKSAIQKAANLAGFKLIHFLPDSVAAAFAYFIPRPLSSPSSVVLLFDLGGGTLDVCLMKVKKNHLQIISEFGDSHLGGRDFDNILVEHFMEKMKTEYGIEKLGDKKLKLLQQCQRIKHSLSIQQQDRLSLNEFAENTFSTIQISREEFQNLCKELMDKIRGIIISALNSSNYSIDKIEKVLQIGGGSQMPMIKNLLDEIFPHSEHCSITNSEELVAIGAANYAYFLKSKNSQCSII